VEVARAKGRGCLARSAKLARFVRNWTLINPCAALARRYS